MRWASPTRTSPTNAPDGGMPVQRAQRRHQQRGGDAAEAIERDREVRGLHAFPGAADARPHAGRRGSIDGGAVFTDVGCALCHTPTLKTGNSGPRAAQPDRQSVLGPADPRHGRGAGRRHPPGAGGPREFRTAPLWGPASGSSSCTTGARRTSRGDPAHRSGSSRDGNASEANEVVSDFNDPAWDNASSRTC